jgi:hypothetical protein
MGVFVIALLCVVTAPVAGEAAELGPDDNFCARLNSLPEGEEVVLAPGEYQGACTIRRGGTADSPLVIRAADPYRPPHLVYDGQTSNVLNVRADHVVIRGLRFGPTQRNVDAIRVYSRADVTVEDCEFSGVGGIAIVANSASTRGLTVRRNVIEDSAATAMYFGCHDGVACALSGLLAERNYIHRVRAPAGEVGYGLQVKLNSSGIIRDNVIVDTKGPGIMVYGSRERATASVVERNFVMGSRTSSGIVIGGGPAMVRSNIAVSNWEAGIGLEDYGRRRLLRDIVVAHNTVYNNISGGILLPGNGLREVIIVNNAAHARLGTAALPGAHTGARISGNVDCARSPCFRNPDGRDFSPLVGSPLIGLGVMGVDAWAPRDDFFGVPRGIPPTVGAVERAAGAILLGPKP